MRTDTSFLAIIPANPRYFFEDILPPNAAATAYYLHKGDLPPFPAAEAAENIQVSVDNVAAILDSTVRKASVYNLVLHNPCPDIAASLKAYIARLVWSWALREAGRTDGEARRRWLEVADASELRSGEWFEFISAVTGEK